MQQKPTSLTQTLQALQAELASGKPPPHPLPDELPLKDIRLADAVFQPRTFDGTRAESAEHVNTLKDAIKNSPEGVIEPLVVWWSGKHWLVLDGHHRLKAYRQLLRERHYARPPLIPVEAYPGTLNQAIARAVELNSRDKLPMTKEDKAERAWKLVALNDPTFSRDAIARATGMSDRTVGNMREARKRFLSEQPDSEPLDWTWAQIKAGRIKPDRDDDWVEQEATRWSQRLIREFGPKIGQNPTILARALEITAKRLPKRLISEWIDEAREVVAEEGPEDAF
jgi:hypothetical protein